MSLSPCHVQGSEWGTGRDDVLEVELLLPAQQVRALEAEARKRGLTVGQALRLLVQDFIRPSGDRQAEDMRGGSSWGGSASALPRAAPPPAAGR